MFKVCIDYWDALKQWERPTVTFPMALGVPTFTLYYKSVSIPRHVPA